MSGKVGVLCDNFAMKCYVGFVENKNAEGPKMWLAARGYVSMSEMDSF